MDSKLKTMEHIFDFTKKTYIMGILNITPDSFSDGGKFNNIDAAIKQVEKMIKDGADIIDIGAESTRPGYELIPEKEEWARMEEILCALLENFSIPISIDTYKAYVADKALKKGAHIINDIWGLQKDPEMAFVASAYECPVVVMHNKINTHYEKDIMEELLSFLSTSMEIGIKAGMNTNQFILDPGLGFGKTVSQNYEVLNRLEMLQTLNHPILLGTSRKSMLGAILDLPPHERVIATTATSVIGVMKGANILRVHDVAENAQAVKITEATLKGVGFIG